MKHLIFAALSLGAAAVFFACSSDDTTSTPSSSNGTDAGASTSNGTNDSGTSSGNDAGTTDAGDGGSTPTVVNGCTTFADLTASSTTTITFPSGVSPAQYSPPCIKVKTGTVVTFSGSFDNHPLEPAGGDTPNPITATETGTEQDFTFADVGTFGYHCGRHPSSMLGAIQVVAD